METHCAQSLGVRIDIWTPGHFGRQDAGVVLDGVVVGRLADASDLVTLDLSGRALVHPLFVPLLVEAGCGRLTTLRHQATAGKLVAREDLGVGQDCVGHKSGGDNGVEFHGCGIEIATNVVARSSVGTIDLRKGQRE